MYALTYDLECIMRYIFRVIFSNNCTRRSRVQLLEKKNDEKNISHNVREARRECAKWRALRASAPPRLPRPSAPSAPVRALRAQMMISRALRASAPSAPTILRAIINFSQLKFILGWHNYVHDYIIVERKTLNYIIAVSLLFRGVCVVIANRVLYSCGKCSTFTSNRCH